MRMALGSNPSASMFDLHEAALRAGQRAFVFCRAPFQTSSQRIVVALKNTHRGARTHDHKVKGLALCRLS